MVLDVLTKNTGSEKVRGIMICAPEPSKIQLEPECFEKMENLKFLMVSNIDICRGLKYLPNGLRVLDWQRFPSSSLPSNFHPQKLVVLNMPESGIKFLKRIQCTSLTHMNLQSCQYIRELPDLSIATPNIKQLSLCECIKLVKVHDSVGCLDKLESLDLSGCIKLKILPSCITMKSLKILILFNCKRVERFPDISQKMENLKFLSLAYTAIRELPSSFRNLSGLERLDVGSYPYTCHLPSSIYELSHLHKLYIHGNVQFPKDVKIGRQALCNSFGGFSKYGFLKLNFLKKLASYFHLSEKFLLSRSKNLNLNDNIMRFNGLRDLLIEDSKFLKTIPKLPKSIRSVDASNCISLNSQSLRKLFFQFGRNLELQPNMKCSSVKGNVLANSHSHQIDYSSQLSFSKFFLIEMELRPTLDVYLFDFGERYSIIVPEKKIPEWFNHQSIESSISFWIGPEFSTFAFYIAFHLVPLKESYANKWGSLRDDIISWVCAVNISINGHKQPFMQPPIFQCLKCDHLWFYGVPHSQLQEKFGDLLQGDQNHVGVSCKISHWTSEFGKFAPVIARMGVHVECICPPQNVDEISELAPLLPPISTSNGLRRRRTSTSYNP
nr:putative wrky transcription factor 19 [Quercus suber]